MAELCGGTLTIGAEGITVLLPTLLELRRAERAAAGTARA
jgi:hypothetical protein